MKAKCIIKVAPLVRLPITRTQVFSYWFEKPIAKGSLVEIPFYNRIVSGIVAGSQVGFRREGGFQLKKVKRIAEEAFLTEKQIQFAKDLANYYLAPLGIVLKFMVPKIVRLRKKKEKKEISKIEFAKRSRVAEEIEKSKEKEIAIVGTKSARDEVIFSILDLLFRKKKQCLYLASEIFPALVFFEKAKNFFPANEVVLIHGAVPKGEIYESWRKIKSGKAKIVIASKVGLFFPFRDLGAVIIEESGDVSHKQWDMSPRYNAAKAAQILADVHGAKIIYSNSLPSVELYEKTKKNRTKLIDIEKNETAGPEIKIANIFQEKRSADFPIGKELYASLSKAVNKKRKTLLVVNRRGFSSFSICRSCKSVFRCPNCERALVYFEEKEKYRCLHCSHKADLLSACPTCGACQFSHQGVGIQLVEKKIKRLFPRVRTLRLDSDVSKSKKRNEKILKDLKNGNFDIIIGTQITLKLGSLRQFDLVAFPSFEDLGSIPDFNTNETVFSMLNQAGDLLGTGGELLVQTSYSDDFLLKLLQSGEKKEFFEKEIKERKKMSYPPFSRLVKISYRDKTKKKVDAETKRIFDLLMTLGNDKIKISEPYEPLVSKKRGYFYKSMLIRAKPEVSIRNLPISPILGGLKKGWVVDVDPVSTM